ncbi:MAG: hypothetical protein AAGA56_13295, partial [Myxococcota bacterium]
SDSATTTWRESIEEKTSEGRSVETFIGATLEAESDFGGIIGIGVKTEFGQKRKYAYKMSVTERTIFQGKIPPIRDNPSTPEDEYLAHKYAVMPFVYEEHYILPDGDPDNDEDRASFFVMSYAVEY